MLRSRLSELCGQLLSHQTPRLELHECTDILLKKVYSLQSSRIRTHCIIIDITIGSIVYGWLTLHRHSMTIDVPVV